MSDSLYPTRLRWQRPKGIAKLDGVQVALTEPPTLDAARVEAIDYAPGIVYMVMWPFGGWQEMTSAEIVAADAYLRRVCGAEPKDSEW